MLEVYNESVYDLLHATGEDLDLQLKPKSEEVHVKGLSWEDVNTGRPGKPKLCSNGGVQGVACCRCLARAALCVQKPVDL